MCSNPLPVEISAFYFLSSSVEYLLFCFIFKAVEHLLHIFAKFCGACLPFVCIDVLLPLVCHTGRLLDFIFCVSAYLWLSPSHVQCLCTSLFCLFFVPHIYCDVHNRCGVCTYYLYQQLNVKGSEVRFGPKTCFLIADLPGMCGKCAEWGFEVILEGTDDRPEETQ